MGDGDPDWFSKWEDELPSPEELMPLTQTLITPDLALAFNIPSTHAAAVPPTPPLLHSSSGQLNSSAELDSGGGGGGSDEPARTLKRPRLVWTPQLHKRFVDAVAHLGIKNAVPKTIMQLMSVDGLTRENVASHLQKYRLYLKRMQGMSAAGGGGSASTSVVDADTDRLFASSPVPPHFLHPGRHPAAGGAAPDHFMPFLPVPTAAVHHHHHHMVGSIPAAHHQMQQQYRHFGGSPLMRQLQQPAQSNGVSPPGHTDELDVANGTQVLTLFPTRDH